jgi:Importin-beta N-terminal domain
MSAQVVAEQIYDLLSQCLSNDSEIRVDAEKKLEVAEAQPDFFASLAMILCASDEDADARVKWLAAVCGKNAVTRSWKRRGSKREAIAVTDEEREYVHGALLTALGIREPTIAVQVSVWIARISRIDFPEAWPALTGELLRRLSSPDATVMCHALVTLDMVLKQLASRRLLQDRKCFQQVTSSLFGVLLALFEAHLCSFVTQDETTRIGSPSYVVLERCMKSLRRLVVHGMPSISEVKEIGSLFAKLTSFPELFFACPGTSLAVPARFSLLAAKLVVRTQERHPIDFQVYLHHFLDVYYSRLLTFDAPASDRLGYQAARFLRNVAQCVEYRINREAIDGLSQGYSEAATPTELARNIVLRFFNPDRTKPLLEAILSRVFIFSQRELQTWIDDPETLLLEEESSEWGGDSMRHECEELVKTLLVRDKERVSAVLLAFTELVGLHQPILLDACYRAIGICVYDISDRIQFESWFENQLAPVLARPKAADIGHIVLKARAVWLIGQFVGQLSRQLRQSVYAILIPLMSFIDQDTVVALTAAKAMQMLVEDLGFYGTDFAQYLSPCLSSTFDMSELCENVETKRDLLAFAATMIDRSPVSSILPLLEPMAKALPAMWLRASDVKSLPVSSGHDENWDLSGTDGRENLFRTAVVLLLTAIVRKLGPHAVCNPSMRELLLRVIEYGTDVSGSNTGGIFMLEEACELWDTVICAVDVYSADLSNLYPRVHEILGHDFDNLKVMFRILEGYALLGGRLFMQQYGESVSELLNNALRNLKDRGCLATCEVIDLILQLFPRDGPILFANVLQRSLHLAASGRESRNLSSAYVYLVLRAVLSNMECVETEILQEDAQAIGTLMTIGLEKLENMYLTRRRKLAALALCVLVAKHGCQNPTVQQCVPQVLNVVVQVLSEIRSSESGKGKVERKSDFDNLLSRVGEEDADQIEARLGADMPGSVRRNILQLEDPSEKLDLGEAARSALASLHNTCLATYEQVISSVDSEVLRQLQTILS